MLCKKKGKNSQVNTEYITSRGATPFKDAGYKNGKKKRGSKDE